MSRPLCASSAILLLLLLPAIALAKPAHKPPHRWHGYGFLPGYHQPQNPNIPVYGEKGAFRSTPDYTPEYWYNGEWHYFGRPGFFRGRYNGGSFGPCWTRTPIGLVWNCG